MGRDGATAIKTYRLVKQILFDLITVLIAGSLVIAHVAAQDMPFYLDFINANIDVHSNGDMLITETQKYFFKTAYLTEPYRYIPLNKVDEITEVTVQEQDKTLFSQTGIEND